MATNFKDVLWNWETMRWEIVVFDMPERRPIEKRAATMAKKRNNRAAAEMPLLASAPGAMDVFLTTADAEEKRLERAELSAQRYCDQLLQHDLDTAERSEMYRKVACEILSPEEYAAALEHLRIYPRQPVYHSDFWEHVVAPKRPELCPHYQDGVHSTTIHGKCPICGVAA